MAATRLLRTHDPSSVHRRLSNYKCLVFLCFCARSVQEVGWRRCLNDRVVPESKEAAMVDNSIVLYFFHPHPLSSVSPHACIPVLHYLEPPVVLIVTPMCAKGQRAPSRQLAPCEAAAVPKTPEPESSWA